MKPMLAKPYDNQPIAGWLLSEKLDGVRALWDGRRLVSRNGNAFAAPAWFVAQLPAGLALDGELYLGRGQFQRTVSIVRKHVAVDAEWRSISYRVFDAPEADGGFEQRLLAAEHSLTGCAVASVLSHTVCCGKAQLEATFAELVAQGAEGVMLRKPGSAYEPKRSACLLKYKPFDSDEASVIGYECGEGRLAGMIGALIVRWKDKVFNVGAGIPDAIRLAPPALGAAVTFGFCGLTDGGLPRFPTFVAERNYE